MSNSSYKLKKIIDKNLNRYYDFDNFRNDLYHKEINNHLIEKSINYLSSEKAFNILSEDPYWPKWNNPWWHILLFYEMNILELVPEKILLFLEEKINTHYIKFFPFLEEEIPKGINPIKQIICHCQLGSIYKVYNKFNNAKNFQWARKWFIKYQIEDGGLNCDESAYTKNLPKSSVISSLPCFEAVLEIEDKTSNEEIFLDKGFDYLLNKKIFRNSKNEIINQNWLSPFFPRFYEFDILRGLSFLINYALLKNKEINLNSIIETLEILDSKISDNNLMISENLFLTENKNELFDLLEKYNKKNENLFLTIEWYENIKKLNFLFKKY